MEVERIVLEVYHHLEVPFRVASTGPYLHFHLLHPRGCGFQGLRGRSQSQANVGLVDGEHD